MDGCDVSVWVMTAKQLEDFVFIALICFAVEHTHFRELLEKGTIFIYNKEERIGGRDKFRRAWR